MLSDTSWQMYMEIVVDHRGIVSFRVAKKELLTKKNQQTFRTS